MLLAFLSGAGQRVGCPAEPGEPLWNQGKANAGEVSPTSLLSRCVEATRETYHGH